MHRNSSKLVPLALISALGLGIALIPALAKSIQSGKGNTAASHLIHGINAQHTRALNADESVRRAPTFAAPNPNSPRLAGDSNGYNADFYVY
jgi:hypothetical protein